MKKVLLVLLTSLCTIALAKERISSLLITPSLDALITNLNESSLEVNNRKLSISQIQTTTSEINPFNDVIIHPPDPKNQGKLMVIGKIGFGQGDTFMLKKCRTESNQIPMKWGCSKVGSSFFHPLNQKISLDEGFYEIKYASDKSLDKGLPMYVEVKARQTTRFKLRQISVPTPNSYTYRVFIDYTDPSSQDKTFLTLWGTVEHEETVQQYCGTSAFCTAFLGNDYRSLKNALHFNSRGELNSYYTNIDKFAHQWKRQYITNTSSDGPFVSVVPGVYGIEFHAADGTIVDRYGIRID